MRFAKSLLLGVAFAGFTSSFALDVQLQPVLFYSSLSGDDFGWLSEEHPDSNNRTVSLNGHGVVLESALGVARDVGATTVQLTFNTGISPEGREGQMQFYGDFTITEPAYIEFFGAIEGNSADEAAVSTIMVGFSSYDGALYAYESETQHGQSPDAAAINGVPDGPFGYVDEDMPLPRLLAPGTYTFTLGLAAWDNSISGSTAFSSAGIAGFTLTAESTPPPPPPVEEPAPPTLDSLSALIDDYLAAGEISRVGLAKALRAQLAQAAKQNGPGPLKGFARLVQAQRGKHISRAAADTLLNILTQIAETGR